MIYTISLKENKIEKKDEIFYFEMAQSYELTDLGINKIIYNDDTDEYKYFDNTNKELDIELNEYQKTVRDTILTTFHSLFDADALNRLKQRKIYDLKTQCTFNDYCDINCNFFCSFGLLLPGDKQHIDLYKSLLNYTDTNLVITDMNGDKQEVTKEQLNTIIEESLINLEYLQKQQQQAIIEIASFNSEESVTNYNAVISPFNFFSSGDQSEIEDLRVKVKNELMYPQALSDGLLELSDQYETTNTENQDAIIELSDLVCELQEEVKQLKAKLGA
nr:MAG TPA: hypothetical protein [Caudoviricetes sp.]